MPDLAEKPTIRLERIQGESNSSSCEDVEDFALTCSVPLIDEDNVMYDVEWVLNGEVVQHEEIYGDTIRNMSSMLMSEIDQMWLVVNLEPIEQVISSIQIMKANTF